ncbi:MAG: desulfoferrodoxin [Methanobacteriaceae archaeon]|nr:desulfoferrodoxin [Methanobacteriaceae archaeon]
MTEKEQVYRCDVCENIVTVLSPGNGNLVCCHVPMKLLNEKHSEDMSIKHKPIIEKQEGIVKVKVGENPHPMEENHHLEWVEIRTGNQLFMVFLKPGDPPEAEFPASNDQEIVARSYCNIHGLWKS